MQCAGRGAGAPFKSFSVAENLQGSIRDNRVPDFSFKDKSKDWTAASGYAKSGHGVGLSQRGAWYAAGQLEKTYAEILSLYYSGTSIVSNYNGSSSGTYATWQAKYGNNTFVNSNSYSGNVYRFQVDLNKWLTAHNPSNIAEDGKWESKSSAATLIFKQAYSDLVNDGKAGPATKEKLFGIYG